MKIGLRFCRTSTTGQTVDEAVVDEVVPVELVRSADDEDDLEECSGRSCNSTLSIRQSISSGALGWPFGTPTAPCNESRTREEAALVDALVCRPFEVCGPIADDEPVDVLPCARPGETPRVSHE